MSLSRSAIPEPTRFPALLLPLSFAVFLTALIAGSSSAHSAVATKKVSLKRRSKTLRKKALQKKNQLAKQSTRTRLRKLRDQQLRNPRQLRNYKLLDAKARAHWYFISGQLTKMLGAEPTAAADVVSITSHPSLRGAVAKIRSIHAQIKAAETRLGVNTGKTSHELTFENGRALFVGTKPLGFHFDVVHANQGLPVGVTIFVHVNGSIAGTPSGKGKLIGEGGIFTNGWYSSFHKDALAEVARRLDSKR